MLPAEAHRQFERLLLRTGEMNYMWTNTESLLIHLIAGLARTDKETAVIVFLTLNTTRARIDLVERLAKMDRCPTELREEVLSRTKELVGLSQIRNRFNHCIYSFDPDSGHAQTILMRISDRKNGLKMGRTDTIDDEELSRLERAIAELATLNQSFWQLIRARDFPV